MEGEYALALYSVRRSRRIAVHKWLCLEARLRSRFRLGEDYTGLPVSIVGLKPEHRLIVGIVFLGLSAICSHCSGRARICAVLALIEDGLSANGMSKVDMGLRDQVAKLEQEKERREEEKMEQQRAKLAPREVLARSVHDALEAEADYLNEEGYALSHSGSTVRLDHALGYVLILCENDRANVCLFLRAEEGGRQARPHPAGNEFVKTVGEAEEAVALRLSHMRDVVAEQDSSTN